MGQQGRRFPNAEGVPFRQEVSPSSLTSDPQRVRRLGMERLQRSGLLTLPYSGRRSEAALSSLALSYGMQRLRCCAPAVSPAAHRVDVPVAMAKPPDWK